MVVAAVVAVISTARYIIDKDEDTALYRINKTLPIKSQK